MSEQTCRVVKPGESWKRFANNRSFVGEFIANPEAAKAKYNLVMSEGQFLDIAELADKLFEHASESLKNTISIEWCDENCCANNCK